METRELRSIEKGFDNITKAIQNLNRTVEKQRTMSESKRVQQLYEEAKESMKILGGVMGANIPIEIDWVSPAIKTKARFEWSETDNGLTITIRLDSDEAHILQRSIAEQPVEYLQLSSVVVDDGN